MSRALGLTVVILTTACGAESWSFDHDASPEDWDASRGEDVAAASVRPDLGEDSDDGDGREASTSHETDSVPEAARRCSVDGDCPSDAPLCLQPAGQCVRCTANLDCSRDSGASVCNSSTGECVECTSSSDCSTANMLPYCDTITDRCVQCLSSSQCSVESICQLASHTCAKMF